MCHWKRQTYLKRLLMKAYVKQDDLRDYEAVDQVFEEYYRKPEKEKA